MLKSLRNKKTSKLIWIGLAILIIPAFVIWGSSSFTRDKEESRGYAGKIFGRKIPLLEYQDAMEAARNQAIIQFGDDLAQLQQYLNLESQAWNRLILLGEAKKRKIKVSDKDVIGMIENYPFFQRKGRFDQRIYLETLQYVFHAQARIFEEQTRQNLMLAKLYNEVTDRINITEEDIKREYQKLNEQVSVYYIVSSPAEFVKDIAVSDEESREYFNKNSLRFKKPLSFNLEYITLTQDGNDKDPATEKISQILRRLNKKEDFKKIAQDFNLKIRETGLFSQTDSIPGIGWSQEILDLVYKSRVGDILEPVLIDKFYYILRLKEKKEPYVPGLEEIKEGVKESFIQEASRGRAKKKIEECLEELKTKYSSKKETDFEKIARSFGLKAGSTGLFKYGTYIEGVGISDEFFLRAQELKEGQLSPIIEAPSGLYLIRLKNKLPIDEGKFNEEETTFSQKLLEQKKNEAFTVFVKELKRKAQLF